MFSKSNDEPGLIAVNPARGPATWRAFGDWNIELIGDQLRPDDRITAEARRVTQYATTDVEKMNAIAEFCLAAVVKCTRVDDGLRMQADLKFSENVIPAENFPRLIKVLDGLLSGCEQAIVLAKK